MLLSEDTPSSIPHILYPLGVFGLEVGKRHQVHMESNEGGTEKHRVQRKKGELFRIGGSEKCLRAK